MCFSTARLRKARSANLTVKVLGCLILCGMVVFYASHLFKSSLDSGRDDHELGDTSTEGPIDLSEITLQVGSGAASIVNSIITLESARDAKCHSTACRLEDYLYGTPLDKAARNARWEFQRELARSVWTQASQEAAGQGREELTKDQLQPCIAKFLQTSHSENGQISVTFCSEKPITISQVRFDQFASIAYSLRAIQSVQLDASTGNGPDLITLSGDGLEALKKTIDTVTVCALLVADERARQANERKVSLVNMREAWRSLIRESVIQPVVESVTRQSLSKAEIRRKAMALLKVTIEGKLAAYRAYNDVSEGMATTLMRKNTERFYAKYPPPNPTHQRQALDNYRNTLIRVMNDFALELLSKADQHAQQIGHRFVRAEDAEWAVDQLMAPEVDDIEDVHFFTNLSNQGENIMLESYDCDSYRDFGMHWMILKTTLDELPATTLLPDSFAVEIVVEAISQYGVLLLRVAGQHAHEKLTAKFLQPIDVHQAREKIRNLSKRHREAPPQVSTTVGIVSSSQLPEVTERKKTYFTDNTEDSGVNYKHRSSHWLSNFRHQHPDSPPTFSGGGIAAEDINADGHMDLLLVGGTGNRLFFGTDQGNFRDVTQTAGITFLRPDGKHAEARKPILADFDNDGRTDILITCAADNHLIYRNLDGLHFQDVSKTARLGGAGLIGGPATVFDYDNDGLLDIYICYFGDYIAGKGPLNGHDSNNALPNKLFRNEGDFHFRDVSAGSGADDQGWSQAVSHTDFDRDGKQDIVIANDFGSNALLRNLGDGKFQNVSKELGVTKFYHSMNVGISDLNDDGYPDVYFSNITTYVKDNKYVMPNENTQMKFDNRAMAAMLWKEANMLYLSQPGEDGLQSYQPSDAIERGPTHTGWAWDAEFLDFDNDGDDDLYCVNGNNDYNIFGHIVPGSELLDVESGDVVGEKGRYYFFNHTHQSNVFFINEGGQLKNRSLASGADFVANSRSTAYIDMDHDGDLDIVVNNFHAPATVLKNNSQELNNNWVKIRLIGDPKKNTNRDAIGARLIASRPGVKQRVMREIQGGSGYLSMDPKQQHIGLGKSTTVDIEIIWPNGDRQEVSNLPCNQVHTIEQTSSVLADDAPSSNQVVRGRAN